MLLLGRLRNHADGCLEFEVIYDLLRLRRVPDIVGELLEILLKPFVLLLVVCQRLQALLLGSFVLIDLILTGLIYCWIDALAHELVLKHAVFFVACSHAFWDTEVAVEACRAATALRVEGGVAVVKWIFLEVLLLEQLGCEPADT